MERLSLLELAGVEGRVRRIDARATNPISVLAWVRTGWKADKKACRRRASNSMAIIASGLIPFLVKEARSPAPTRKRPRGADD